MKRAFYPPLIALFLVLALFNANIRQLTSPNDVITPLLISLGITGTIWIVLRLALKSWSRAALPATLLTIMCLEYGHFRGVFGLSLSITLAIWVSVFVVGALLTTRIKRLPTLTLNVVACTLVLVVLIPFSMFVLTAPTTVPTATRSDSSNTPSAVHLPDIYYIIVDEYSRSDVLLGTCDFDNSGFIDYLQSKDFYISNDYANYPVSGLSLASSLNVDYIPESVNNSNPYTYTRNIYNLIRNNEVCRQLKQRGYIIINIGSLYRLTSCFELEDIDYEYSGRSEFFSLYYGVSMFYIVSTPEHDHYNRTLYQFEKLKEITKMSEPTFTFVHILIAHTPFVFNANGSFGGLRDCTPEIYAEQIEVANSMLRKTVDKILSRDSDAIIIIQGDTGFCLNMNIEEGPHVLWARLGSLNAIRAPECSNEFTSPVNTFRHIFNQYFDTQYEILLDKYFWARQFTPPFEVYEVTEELKNYEKGANK